MKNALILVDLQNDFCPGGALAVADGDAVIPIANKLQTQFDLVIATQDWHPQDHVSFAVNHPGRQLGDIIELDNHIEQVLWPPHCVQNSTGADFHPGLNQKNIHHIVHKGSERHIDSYSAFFDNEHLRSTGLSDYLRAQQVTEVFIMGLATDYCVKYSALDAVHEGFHVYVIQDGCRGIELQPGDIEQAFQAMRKAGVKLITSADIAQSNR